MNAPDRIYGWKDAQLSLARHYGGCTFGGFDYVIDHSYPGHPFHAPLVKVSVLAAEAKSKKSLEKAEGAANTEKQGSLF
jgi:hypothetical protein